MKLNSERIDQAFGLLALHFDQADAPKTRLVICGGASLIAAKVVFRTTKDVDIVAFRTEAGALVAPVPLPD